MATLTGDFDYWAIYDHPTDYPDHYVVRRWMTPPDGHPVPSPHAHLAMTIEEARALIPVGFVNVGRAYEIDPKILEVWI